MNDRMLLCLKYVGRISRANVSGSEITNESPFAVQQIVCCVDGDETIWKSFVRNGAMLVEPIASRPRGTRESMTG